MLAQFAARGCQCGTEIAAGNSLQSLYRTFSAAGPQSHCSIPAGATRVNSNPDFAKRS